MYPYHDLSALNSPFYAVVVAAVGTGEAGPDHMIGECFAVSALYHHAAPPSEAL